jgi:two-component system chemotaxis response regulator CheB
VILSPVRARAGDVARVMICDDSVVIRGAVTRMLEGDPQIRVVARAADGRQALAEIARLRGEINMVVLDIEMPVMDGMEALPLPLPLLLLLLLLLRAAPGLRVIMASTLTTRSADIAMRALRLGAADYVPKPAAAAIADDSFRRELLAKVKGLARLRRAPACMAASATLSAAPVLRAAGVGRQFYRRAAGAVHPMPCHVARDGETLEPGCIVLAPGDQHLLVEEAGGVLRARVSDDPQENFCRPAVDPMRRSASLACGGRVLAEMLTGMGHDGLAGTRQIVAAGGTAIAQDEATSVVWGMPGAIASAGLCHAVLSLPAIAGRPRALIGRNAE